MVAIKGMEMPSCCINCGLLGKKEMSCSIYPRRDLDIITVATNRPDWCPLVETGICEDCVKGHKYKDIDECFCDYLQDDVDTDFYCTEFKKRGSEE